MSEDFGSLTKEEREQIDMANMPKRQNISLVYFFRERDGEVDSEKYR